ncbi:MAG: CBS and ACT domain-containing protein [Spirochaetaceae bacterium]|jgi:acetoin utilization protein AcuB|nr:CBS and ACT domain-containing protein [Spirochaetaceae bacterium]
MLVHRIMTKNPVFVEPAMPVSDARALMEKEKIGRLPVIDTRRRALTGIITKKDMLKAGPSPATSLDMYEISYLLSKLTVDKVMTRNVITIAETEVVEEAARVMTAHDISCLPVMRGDLLVGIITGTDLFHAFVDAFGGRRQGIRVTFVMEDKPGMLAKVAGAISEKGGCIEAFITQEGDELTHKRGTLKITGIDQQTVEAIARALPVTIEDIIHTTA